MKQNSRDNTGALFKNRKRSSDKHPEYTGSAMIGGVKYYLSAWINEYEGNKYFKISFKPAEQGDSSDGEKDVPF